MKRPHPTVEKECVVCHKKFQTISCGKKTTKTCSIDCCVVMRYGHKQHERLCTQCNSPIPKLRGSDGRLLRRNLCSNECRQASLATTSAKNSKRFRKPLAKCPMCGTEIARRNKVCGSKRCISIRLSYVHNAIKEVCKFSPEKESDLKFMLDIMARKGYIEGENPREPYRFTIQEGSILYVDLPPHPLSDDGKLCASEEFTLYGYDLEQEAEEEGAYPSTFQELQDWIEGGQASTHEAMER